MVAAATAARPKRSSFSRTSAGMPAPPFTKGVWGFNGTERPGAVYLASVLATHAQKGLPAFGIYGHEVQDVNEVDGIPADVRDSGLSSRPSLQWAFVQAKAFSNCSRL